MHTCIQTLNLSLHFLYCFFPAVIRKHSIMSTFLKIKKMNF